MRWEYKTIKLRTSGFWLGGELNEVQFNNLLNELGREQWELVAAFDTNESYGVTRDVVAVLKRPLES